MLFAPCSRSGLGLNMVRAVSNRRGVVRLPGLSMGICDGKCDTGTGSVRVLRFSPVTSSPPIRRTHLHLDAAIIRKTSGEVQELSKKAALFRMSGSIFRGSAVTSLLAGHFRTSLVSSRSGENDVNALLPYITMKESRFVVT